jgi:ABC-2 type transport system permease protein
MSHLGNIFIKEVRELLTPATFLPIIVMAVIFGGMGNTIGGIEEGLEEPPVVGIINADVGVYSSLAVAVFEQASNVVFNSTDIDDKQQAINTLNNKDGVALIIIQQNFSDNIIQGTPGEFEVYWIMSGGGILDSISSSVVEELINIVNTNITMEIISNDETINATTALTPTIRNETTYFKGTELEGVSPTQLASILAQQSTFIPVIIMIIIIMSGQMVISSMALEKENKTLETLLTLPVKRTNIVAGKIIASAFIGLLLAVIYMIGLGYYMSSSLFGLKELSADATIALSLSGVDFIIIGASIFVTLIAALALCMLLGTLAKNFKSAQTLTFPVAMLALIPMFLTMFKDFDTMPMALKGLIFGIPFSHPMMAPRALLFDDYLLVISGIIYVAIFAIILILIVVWVFKTDRILTGSFGKWKGLFKKRFSR